MILKRTVRNLISLKKFNIKFQFNITVISFRFELSAVCFEFFLGQEYIV
jgi:hypothetical protein